MYKSIKDQYLPTDILSAFREYLQSCKYSIPTVKNYLSDTRHLILWFKENYSAFEFSQINEKSLRSYRSFLKEKFRSKPAISARRLSSLRKFLYFAQGKNLVTADIVKAADQLLDESKKHDAPIPFPVPIVLSAPASTEGYSREEEEPEATPDLSDKKLHQKAIYHIKNTRPAWYHKYHKMGFSTPAHYTILFLIVAALAGLLFNELVLGPSLDKAKNDLAGQFGSVLPATAPPRILSFQGRLTNNSDQPVTVATNIVFRIWDQASGGTEGDCAGFNEDCFWISKTWTVTPDQNGVFSVQLGDTSQSDTAIPSTLFTDYSELYLGVTVESDTEMTPRQRIASSSYALNSDALDGVDSTSFLRSDANDSFSSGTLTIDDGTTLTVNSSAINLGNAAGDAIGVNGTTTFNTDTNVTLAGTENIAVTSDLVGSVDILSIIGSPSGSAGTAQGIFIQQAANGNTNGLDVGIKIDNADTDLLLTDAISITNTGAFGNGYTNFLNTPTIDITGAGAITGATGVSSTGTITFGSMITDANAVLYTDTSGVVTRVVETETGGECLTSGAGASGIPVWTTCPGGTFSGEVDTTTNDSLTFTTDDASPPTGVRSIYAGDTSSLILNSVTGGLVAIEINDSGEYSFSATTLDFNANTITDVGNITATAAITIASTGAGNDVIINGADILDVQDNATFAGTVDITGTATFSGDITANDAGADTILIGQSGATDDTVTIAGDLSLTDDNWSITAAGLLTTASNAAINGGNITSTTTLTLDATSTVIIPDADTFQTNDVTSTSGLTLGSGANGNITLTPNGTGDIVVSGDAGSNLQVTFGEAPGVDMTAISNATFGATATTIDGLQIDFETAGTTASADNAGLRINVTSNNSGTTTTLEGIYIGNLTSAEANSTETALKIGTGWDSGITVESGGITISGGTLTYSSANRPARKVVLSAEYPGASLFGDGTNNTGSMTSDYTNSTTGDRHTYYEWSSSSGSLQDYTIVVRFTLPDDFSAWATSNAVLVDFVTESTNSANNQLDISLFLETAASADGSSDNNVSSGAGTWTTTNIDDSVLGDCNAAGETCVLEVYMQSLSDNYARIGDITLNYLGSY